MFESIPDPGKTGIGGAYMTGSQGLQEEMSARPGFVWQKKPGRVF